MTGDGKIQVLNAEEIRALAPMPRLIECLQAGRSRTWQALEGVTILSPDINRVGEMFNYPRKQRCCVSCGSSRLRVAIRPDRPRGLIEFDVKRSIEVIKVCEDRRAAHVSRPPKKARTAD